MTQFMSKAVGIDLGTTNSAVAVMNASDTDVHIHQDPVTRSRTTPSSVWRNPTTGEMVVGRKAIRRAGGTPAPARSVKRLMGQGTKLSLSGLEMSPQQVSAEILKEMRRQIQETASQMDSAETTWLVDRAVITVPAYFDQPQIDATREAAELAGLRALDLLHEPTAAVCHHCWRTGTRDGTFLVYDLGGGTFDVSVVRCTSGTYEVLGISGNNMLGGDDIDHDIARLLQKRLIEDEWAMDLDPANDPADRLRFTQLTILAERVKKGLSEEGEYLLRDTGTITDKMGNPVIIETEIERRDVEAAARPHIERTLAYCHEALAKAEERAGVTLADVDRVILAGGSTHMPLVREMVAAQLCADSRAPEPVYESVDTIVAQGAAIRAASVGGLTAYDQDRRVRVTFQGISASGTARTSIGGRAETVAADGPDLTDGRIELTTPDGDGDVADLSPSGAFSFTRIPLEPDMQTHLGFDVFDATGSLVASVNRSITHQKGAETGIPGNASKVAVCSKAIKLEVSRGGRTQRRDLVPELEGLPTSAEFDFSHPGGTEVLHFPLYQGSKQIQVVPVRVPSSIPRGAPIRLTVRMEVSYEILVTGTIGDQAFEFDVQAPPMRELPSQESVTRLRSDFEDARVYLSSGKQNVATLRFERAHSAFAAASERGDTDKAMHEYEQMEESLSMVSRGTSPLEPPKADFDDLVRRCLDLNEYLGSSPSQAGAPHDQQEMVQNIEAQRLHGERAFRDDDQDSYGEAFQQLNGYLEYLSGLYRKSLSFEEPLSETELAMSAHRAATEGADRTRQLAEAQGRPDLRDEVVGIQNQLQELGTRIGHDPRGARDKSTALAAQLNQVQNILQRQRSSTTVLVEDGDL